MRFIASLISGTAIFVILPSKKKRKKKEMLKNAYQKWCYALLFHSSEISFLSYSLN